MEIENFSHQSLAKAPKPTYAFGMAHKKAGGSTSNVRDSRAKRRGVKLFAGERVSAGGIIVRQKGTKFRPGKNTYLGKDWTLHAAIAGVVRFSQKRIEKFNSRSERCTVVHVDNTCNS